jgi:hypothetical protein
LVVGARSARRPAGRARLLRRRQSRELPDSDDPVCHNRLQAWRANLRCAMERMLFLFINNLCVFIVMINKVKGRRFGVSGRVGVTTSRALIALCAALS